MNALELAASVKRRAAQLGFSAAGVTDLAPPPHTAELTRWLASGLAGNMTYINRQAAKRREPARIVAGATRAVMVAWDYYQPDPAPEPGTGIVAKYARGEDYHLVLAEPLEQLADFIREIGPANTIARAFTDAGPVPERELAQRAGLGWIGKNTLLIRPRAGSFFFIGAVFTNLDLALDDPFEADRCGSCRRCLEACPTDAFIDERVLDSRRCISYLTIEFKGEIEPDLARGMGNRVFGCDVCQDVCPWNVQFAEAVAAGNSYQALVDLQHLATISDEDFASRFGRTALARPGPARMRRNATIALANEAEEPACPKP